MGRRVGNPLARIILRTPPTTQPTHGRCRRNRPAQSDRGWNVGEWHTQVDATCITAATMPRPTDHRLAVPCSGGALDDRVVAPPTAPTGASLPPEHRSHQSIAPTGAPLPLEHRSHRSHGHGSRHGASRRVGRPSLVAPRDGRPAFTVLAPHSTLGVRSCVRMAWSLDKPARHRHAPESLSRPLLRSAAPSPATKSPISQYRKQSLRLLEPITT